LTFSSVNSLEGMARLSWLVFRITTSHIFYVLAALLLL